jgi:dipeptidyl aminopeptidase/acylaminoacyl peptidase
MKKLLPFGLWPSPITPAMLGRRIRLEDVQWNDRDNSLVWLEGRSGQGALVIRVEEGAHHDLINEMSVHANIGYGGGDFTVSQSKVFFVSGGRIYRRGLGYGEARPSTPPYGSAASPALSPDGQWVMYNHSDGEIDVLALVDAEGNDWPMQLRRGADFYMQPAWHPNGQQIAWVEWNHPNMPWDGSSIILGKLQGDPLKIEKIEIIAGDQQTPVSQPLFSPNGQWLSYITADGEGESLVLMDLQKGTRQKLVNGNGHLLSQPAWVQGMRSYAWSKTSKRLFIIRNFAGSASLWSVDLESRQETQIDISPYTWISQISISPLDDQLAFLASAPNIPERVVRWDGQHLHVECHSETESIFPDMFPAANPITWAAPDGTTVHGIYYPPTHIDYMAEGLPPAILYVHGGPTSASLIEYFSERSYFTSRGYAWLDVNFRGSTGYGSSYMKAMHQRWGEVDTEDAAGAANALIKGKLADPERLVISGGSAGGYLVLNAMIHYPGLFKAGVCRYGVSNLFTLDLDTHKFEKHYTASMVGVLPEAAGRYHAWSPIFNAGNIQDPLAVFQGSIDKVVTPDQSESIVAELSKRGIPHIYRLYDGEGHGFRKTETIIDYLEQTERFLQQYVLFAPGKISNQA